MRANLKTRVIPTGIVMRRSFYMPALNIIGRLCASYIDREISFQHTVILMPVNLGDKIYAAAAGIHNHILLYYRIAVGIFKTNGTAKRPMLCKCAAFKLRILAVL